MTEISICVGIDRATGEKEVLAGPIVTEVSDGVTHHAVVVAFEAAIRNPADRVKYRTIAAMVQNQPYGDVSLPLPKPAKPVQEKPFSGLGDLTVSQLREYAAEQSIEIPAEITKKTAIIKFLVAELAKLAD